MSAKILLQACQNFPDLRLVFYLKTILKKGGFMWKDIKEALNSFLALYLLSCFVAFVFTGAILIGVLFLPIAFLVMLFLVIKELLKPKKKPENSYVPIEHIFGKEDPAVRVLDEQLPGLKEWMDSVRLRWSYYWHNDKFTFNR
jgi:hypothetical protein